MFEFPEGVDDPDLQAALARGCLGKRKLDRKQKRRALMGLHRRGEKNVSFYRCQLCGWFHVGHHQSRR